MNFTFLIQTRHAEKTRYSTRNVQHGANDAGNAYEVRAFVDGDEGNYNKGFAARKALLGTSSTVNCEIPLNRYSFFEALEGKLLRSTKPELKLKLKKIPT